MFKTFLPVLENKNTNKGRADLLEKQVAICITIAESKRCQPSILGPTHSLDLWWDEAGGRSRTQPRQAQ